jgi:glycosidase
VIRRSRLKKSTLFEMESAPGLEEVQQEYLDLAQALWNGTAGGPIERIHTSNDKTIFSFLREKDSDQVFVVLNLSDQAQEFTLEGNRYEGTYTDVFSGEVITFIGDASLQMGPWSYLVFEK